MKSPNTKREVALKKEGYTAVAGIDEAGRGAWAGPLVAAAVVLPEDFSEKGVRDSKELSHDERKRLFDVIEDQALAIGVGQVEPFEMDFFGMTQATQLAFRRALSAIQGKFDYVLCDAFELSGSNVPCEGIVKGDQKVLSIAAASIIAKETRDAIMKEYADEFPEYGFESHVGYGTARHAEMIQMHGALNIHRKLFLRKSMSGIGIV